jgi:L-seryl-tRNA(Ser) seleniumtransferase
LARIRETILQADERDLSGLHRERADWMLEVLNEARVILAPSLRRLINATGVIIHTNLGRSLLAYDALRAVHEVASRYSNLEFDLKEGHRGSRYIHVEGLLCRLTGAEAAMVVNNNAGAVLIALDALARGGEVVLSRGQLVEIGGSFRMPDVMAQSGARLVEVGTTNKTHLRDFEGAIGPDTALLLRVHASNYRIIGFTQEVPPVDLVALGRRHDIPVMEDLGSGCLLDLGAWGLEPEPTVQEVLRTGMDLVTFSGDKLLGGPQAGLILGRKALVEKIRKHPLARALRIDKLTLAALEYTLRLYWDPSEAVQSIPTLRMLSMTEGEVKTRANRFVRRIRKEAIPQLRVVTRPDLSQVGGGALPLLELPTWGVSLHVEDLSAAKLERKLRNADPPVIGRITEDVFYLDFRTVQDQDIRALVRVISRVCS